MFADCLLALLNADEGSDPSDPIDKKAAAMVIGKALAIYIASNTKR